MGRLKLETTIVYNPEKEKFEVSTNTELPRIVLGQTLLKYAAEEFVKNLNNLLDQGIIYKRSDMHEEFKEFCKKHSDKSKEDSAAAQILFHPVKLKKEEPYYPSVDETNSGILG